MHTTRNAFAWIDKWMGIHSTYWWEPFINFVLCVIVVVMWSGFCRSLVRRWIWNFSSVYSDTVHQKMRRLFFHPNYSILHIRSELLFFFISAQSNVLFSCLLTTTTRSLHPIAYFSCYFFFLSSNSLNKFIICLVLFSFCCCRRTHFIMPLHVEITVQKKNQKHGYGHRKRK